MYLRLAVEMVRIRSLGGETFLYNSFDGLRFHLYQCSDQCELLSQRNQVSLLERHLSNCSILEIVSTDSKRLSRFGDPVLLHRSHGSHCSSGELLLGLNACY